MNMRALLLLILIAAAPLAVRAQEFSGVSGIAIDADSGKVLWSKDRDTPRYPASTTKIMTALLMIEHCTPDEIITAPADIENTKESSMHLKPFEQVSMQDMLYALMLRSANDGCVAVALHISGSVPAFAKLMNERAKELGCTHTHFDNPNGLNDKNHTISAHDLALIAREAMKYPIFREVVKTHKHEIARSVNQSDLVMVSKNKWLLKDPTADGIKTGYTVPAGHCYVGSATRNHFRVITVIFKSQHWQEDHKNLLDYAFAKYQAAEVAAAGISLGTGEVKNGTLPKVSLGLMESVTEVVRKDAATFQTRPEPIALTAPVRTGQRAGTLVITDTDGFSRSVPLVALQDVAAQTFVGGVAKSTGGFMSYGFVGGTLFIGAAMMRRKARRMRFYGRSSTRRSI